MKTIKVHVQANAKVNKVVDSYNDGIKVAIKAKPVDGEANDQLVKFIGDYYKVKKSQVSIIKGFKSKDKVIRIND
ncbi:MAG: DUF167 domain-containing protein [Mycoplasmataceae bacterium]|jgi:uncharacterized protein (TIGR00251 family)|nr:DUF167 domain-containing protein [Mycoplasmataceae bacterium]